MVSEMKLHLAQRIRDWMLDNKMTQAEVAIFLETSQPRVSLIVNKHLATVSLEALLAYVGKLGYTATLNIH